MPSTFRKAQKYNQATPNQSSTLSPPNSATALTPLLRAGQTFQQATQVQPLGLCPNQGWSRHRPNKLANTRQNPAFAQLSRQWVASTLAFPVGVASTSSLRNLCRRLAGGKPAVDLGTLVKRTLPLRHPIHRLIFQWETTNVGPLMGGIVPKGLSQPPALGSFVAPTKLSHFLSGAIHGGDRGREGR